MQRTRPPLSLALSEDQPLQYADVGINSGSTDNWLLPFSYTDNQQNNGYISSAIYLQFSWRGFWRLTNEGLGLVGNCWYYSNTTTICVTVIQYPMDFMTVECVSGAMSFNIAEIIILLCVPWHHSRQWRMVQKYQKSSIRLPYFRPTMQKEHFFAKVRQACSISPTVGHGSEVTQYNAPSQPLHSGGPVNRGKLTNRMAKFFGN